MVTVIKHTINIGYFSNKANNCKRCRRVCSMGVFLCEGWGCLKVGRREMVLRWRRECEEDSGSQMSPLAF